MLRNMRKVLGIVLSFCMIATIFPVLSYGANERIQKIEVNVGDLVPGGKLEGISRSINPNIPAYRGNSGINEQNKNQLQWDVIVAEHTAKVIVNKNDGSIAGKEFTDKNLFDKDNNGEIFNHLPYRIEKVNLYEACEKNEDGSVKILENGTCKLKKYYEHAGSVQLGSREFKKNSVYSVEIYFFTGLEAGNDALANNVFDNSLSGRVISGSGHAGSGDYPAPQVFVNGEECIDKGYQPADNGFYANIRRKDNSSIYFYTKETVSPEISLDIINDKNSFVLTDDASVAATVELIKENKPIKVTNRDLQTDESKEDKYYVKEQQLVYRDKAAGGDWKTVGNNDSYNVNYEYAIKAEVQPKVLYKFNDDAPVLSGSLAQAGAVVSRQGQSVFAVISLPSSEAKRKLVPSDIEANLKMPVLGGTPNRRVEITKGREYVKGSEVTWFANDVEMNKTAVFEKTDVLYKAKIKIKPSSNVVYNPDLFKNKKIKINGTEVMVLSADDETFVVEMIDYAKIDSGMRRIDYVEAYPNKIDAEIGKTYDFVANVHGENLLDWGVKWEVRGAKSSDTKIDENGKLTISNKESAKVLTVVATSRERSVESKQAELTVNIKNPYSGPASSGSSGFIIIPGATSAGSGKVNMQSKADELKKEEPKKISEKKVSFIDVHANSWYEEPVSYVIEKGIMTGVSNTNFAPEKNTSRAMAAAVLYRLSGSKKNVGDTMFMDVAAGNWYTDAVLWAGNNGIINGMPDKTFKPEQNITREQLVAVLYNYSKFKGHDTKIISSPYTFADLNDISVYAKDAMSWAVEQGIVKGTNFNKIKPQESVTRAQLAAIISRYVQKFEKR